jgi:hypothetical protein
MSITNIWSTHPRKISNAHAHQERTWAQQQLHRMLAKDLQDRVPAPVSLPQLQCLTPESDCLLADNLTSNYRRG